MKPVISLCLLAGLLPAAVQPIRTPSEVGLQNETARIVFDARTGQLLSLKNLSRNDEYLKDRQDNGGPFTIYSDFRAEFIVAAQGTVFRTSSDPAQVAALAVAPPRCRVTDASFRRVTGGLTLQLTYQDLDARWRTDLEVWLAERGGNSEWELRVTNLRPEAVPMMTAFPDISGFRLGPDGSTNMQTTLREAGGITPAWTKAGGIYGDGGQLSMQWHALFDRPAGDHFGLIVMDPEIRNKWFRLIKPRMQVIYFPPQTLQPGGTWKSPRTRLMIGDGDWKPVARSYREWFGGAFRMAERPEWADRLDGWMGVWFAKRGGVLPPGGCGVTAAHCLDSFADLPENYLERPVDLHEYAFHSRSSAIDPPVHTDGDNILREDLGGAPALKIGIEKVHRLGYRFAFYIEGYIVHQSSDLAKSGRAARWSTMHRDGTIVGNYTKHGFFHMCPGSTEWQDYLATSVSRLVRETGADAVRLDSLGFYFNPCFNPAHHHETPYGYNLWIQQLLDKVSRAVLAANPDCVFTTEAPVDFYSQWFHGALHLTWTLGREIPPMRIALPGYRPYMYPQGGPIFNSLSGFTGGGSGYGGSDTVRAWDENWRAMRHGVAHTLLYGEVGDQDPEPSLPDVTCRLFHGPGYAVVVCARVEGMTSWNFPKEVRLPAEHAPISVRVRGARGPYESAFLYDLERATVAPTSFRRDGADLLLDVRGTNWFMVVLRAPDGPAVGAIDPVPELHAGQSVPLELRLLGPRNKMRATLSVRGLQLSGGDVQVPGRANLMVPAGTPPGRYQVQLDGPGLIGMKRFVVVAAPK